MSATPEVALATNEGPLAMPARSNRILGFLQLRPTQRLRVSGWLSSEHFINIDSKG
jgi:hypothetical protein